MMDKIGDNKCWIVRHPDIGPIVQSLAYHKSLAIARFIAWNKKCWGDEGFDNWRKAKRDRWECIKVRIEERWL